MKKILLMSALALALAAGPAAAFAQTTTDATTTPPAATSTSATTTPFKISIMKHLCRPGISSLSDLTAVAAASGTDPVARFFAMELACPTTALPGDEAATSTIAAPRLAFGFAVTGLGAANASTTATTTQSLNDAAYVAHKICETDAGADFDGNGTTSPATCLDASHYEFSGLALHATSTGTTTATTTEALVRIFESELPSGYRFGALSFTPPQVKANDDLGSFVSADSGDRLIVLDVATDTDRTVMLHIFNFLTATTSTSTPGNGTSTPGTGTSTPGTGTTTPGTGTTTPDSLQGRLDLMRSRIESRMNDLRARLDEFRQRIGDR